MDKDKIIEQFGEECPNNGCNNQGYIVVQTNERQYITRDMASDACDMSLEGQEIGEDEFEQEQCEFCYRNKKSKFNLRQMLELKEKE